MLVEKNRKVRLSFRIEESAKCETELKIVKELVTIAIFEMVKYHKQVYPSHIPLKTEEISAHFDSIEVNSNLNFSLHTEYSYGKRKWNSNIIQKYPCLIDAQKNGVPQLWKNHEWSTDFADFIIELMKDKRHPETIEIHPPFYDYIDMKTFIKVYNTFENKIKNHFPNVSILIENRCGSIYKGGKFLISTINDLYQLSEQINLNNLSLKIAYDIPQIYTAHKSIEEKQYLDLLEKTLLIRKYIGGVHLWGKKISATGRKVSHCGNLNTYFQNSQTKQNFLNKLELCFNDGVVRKFVLEVNSGNEDLLSILSDLEANGFQFV